MSMIDSSARQAMIQQLQDEIDRLALLVFEAKKQSDRIQAAADALGDPILANLEPGLAAATPRRGGRSGKTKSRPHGRTAA
jgi:hypothetical protein